MNGKCLSFHLFKRVDKKPLLKRLCDYCPSPLSVFSSSSSSVFDSISSSKDTTSSISTTSSLTEELFTTVPPRWTFQEFNDIPTFIQDYIDNTGTITEGSKTALMIQQCHSVIIVEDVHFGYSRLPDDVKTFTPDRMVVAAIIVSNENTVLSYGINNTSLNEAFENPVKKILVDAMIFNESIKNSKRRVLAMIIIHHLVQLCKSNEIASINASSNDETFQYFLDSGFC
jgi:hypothetical protein